MGNNVLEILITAKDEASEKLKGIEGIAGKLGLAFGAAGGAIIGVLAKTVEAASEAQVQMAKVDATLTAMGKNTPAVASAIQKAADATLKLGFDNEEASVSIAKLYQRTGDLTEATKLNALAMDLSRAKNIDLTTASTLVGQVLAGNGRVLKAYGIDIKETASPLEALGELQTRVAGQASAFSKTFEGQSQVFKQNFGELMELIGSQLLPILTSVLQHMQPILIAIKEWTEAHPTLVRYIVLAVAALGGLLLVLGIVAGVVAGVTAALASTAVVISVSVVAAIAVLVGITAVLIAKWTEVKQFFKDTWEGIKIIFKESIDALLDYFKPLIDIIQRVIDLASRVGSAISTGISVVSKSISGKKAQGGSVSGGSTYLVGENGAELFTAPSTGSIVPNNALGGGSSAINLNVVIRGGLITEDVAKSIGDIMIAQFRRTAKI